jgi:uncharacterized protein (TIGR03437 family)
MGGAYGQAQVVLQYVSEDSRSQARVLATDSSGSSFTVLNVTEPWGQPQIRVIKTNVQGSVLGTIDFGGSESMPAGAVTDSQGNLLIVGTTYLSDFPSVALGISATSAQAAFIVKINAQLTQILFATRLGGAVGGPQGSGNRVPTTSGNAIAIDSADNVYVTGSTSAIDFPVTAGAAQTQPPSGDSFGFPSYSFVTELTSAGNKIVYSTYFGANGATCVGGSSCIGVFGQTSANAIAIDSAGDAVIAGNTDASSLPITLGTPGQQCNCTNQIQSGFVAKFSTGGSQLVWATFVNPTGVPFPLESNVSVTAIALEPNGNVVIGGTAPAGFPTTTGAIQTTYPAGETQGEGVVYAGFVAEYSSSGQQVVFSTYLGGGLLATGENPNGITALTVDAQGTIWVTGGSIPTALPLPSGTPLLGNTYVLDLSSSGTLLPDSFTAPSGAAGQGIASLPQGNVVALGISGSLLTVGSGPSVKTPPPGPALVGVASSAGFQVSGQVAPYELISLYGDGIGPSTPVNGQVTNGVLSNSLNGLQVLFDGTPAPLLYAGPNQINLIVPSVVAGRSTTAFQITGPGTISNIQGPELFVVPSQPQVFATAGSLLNPAIAFNQDGTVNSAVNPALTASIVTVWATGAGMPIIPEADGSIGSTTRPQSLALPVSILSNGFSNGGPSDSLEVLYAGDAPDLAVGVMQVNFRLPAEAQSGVGQLQLRLQVGDSASATFGVYVRQ